MSSARGVFSLVVAAFACVLLLLLGTAAAAAASTIEGEVTAEDGGAPLEEVLVCAYALDEEFEEFCAPTGAAGSYAIGGLEAGGYKVEFWPRFGGLPYYSEYWDDRELFSAADKITLGAGETRTGIDAELERSGAIEGTVSAAGGAPLGEIEVCAYGEENYGCGWTDGDGGYTINELPEDVYEIEFFDWEGTYITQYFDHRDHWQEADEVEVESGETVTGVDADMRPGGQIRGTVSAASNGMPLPEIWVCAIESAAARLVSCSDTNFSGQYTLPGLRSDAYRVIFSIDFGEWFGEEPEPDGYDTQYYSGQTALAAANPVAVIAPGATAGIDARLRRTGEVVVPPPPPPAPPVVKKKTPKKSCKRGFRKKRVKGKVRCVKVHKGKRGKQGKRRNGGKPRVRALLRY